ncbi:MAG: gamma-glutamyl-gamma-aminobutyrate hydrolase family protein [Cytophagaceae bacterium]|nr:gamma-glutamyl-gamma-aminobutyrate hydrolase family protein [Cytophagaceae bacterium]
MKESKLGKDFKKTIIGVTDCSKFENYYSWIQSYASTIEVIKLSEKSNNFEDVKRCDGIVFSGGEDVHPRFYGKPEYLKYCHQTDVNEKRDEFELRLMEFAKENNLPVLGICRGMQLYNVFAGGTLIPDIPSWGKEDHSKLNNRDRYHQVNLDPGSWMASLIGDTIGEINSNHHQAVDKVGEGLALSGFSEDKVAEAAERKDPQGKSFLCLVQWHPERMLDQQSNFVSKIRAAFIGACANFKLLSSDKKGH